MGSSSVLMVDEGRIGGPAGRGLSEQHRARFGRIAAAPGVIGVHGRVLLVMHLYWLHAIDPEWTERNLVYRLEWDWVDRDETISTRGSFHSILAQDRRYSSRLARRCWRRCDSELQLARMPMNACVCSWATSLSKFPSAFDHDQTVAALHDIGVDGCAQIVRAFERKLRDAGPMAPSLWHERIDPWLKGHWPVDQELRIGRLARKAIEVALLTRQAFPDALESSRKIKIDGCFGGR